MYQIQPSNSICCFMHGHNNILAILHVTADQVYKMHICGPIQVQFVCMLSFSYKNLHTSFLTAFCSIWHNTFFKRPSYFKNILTKEVFKSHMKKGVHFYLSQLSKCWKSTLRDKVINFHCIWNMFTKPSNYTQLLIKPLIRDLLTSLEICCLDAQIGDN